MQAAFDGWGTCDKAVCRILGCNDKAEVAEIAATFERKYQVGLGTRRPTCRIYGTCLYGVTLA